MKNILILFLLISIIFGCNNPSKENVLKVVNKDMPILKQLFLVNPLYDTVLKCKHGTEIYIEANSFSYEDKDSSAINSSAKISFEVLEYVRLTDMVLNKLSTLSDGKIIETGGMLYISAFINNRKITVKENKKINVYFPSKSKNFLSFYSNGNENIDSLNWTLGGIENLPVAQVRQDTSLFLNDTLKWDKNDKKLNVLSFKKLGWINCDRFLNFDNTTDIFVKTEGSNLDSSAFCSIILKNYNSIIPGKISENGSMKFSSLPINETIIIFLIAYRDCNYYFGIKEVQVKEKEIYSVSLEIVSKEQLKDRIEELDKGQPL